MKKGLLIAIFLFLLSGCTHTPIQTQVSTVVESGTPSPSAGSTMEATPSLLPTHSPTALLSSDTPQPTEIITAGPEDIGDLEPSPVQDDSFIDIPLVLDADEQDGRRLSEVAVSDGKVVYYRKDSYFDSKKGGYLFDYFTKIMKYNKASEKSTEIYSSKNKGFVLNLLIDSMGALYYTLAENICPDKPMCLYRYANGKSTQLLNDIDYILCLENDKLYYHKTNNELDTSIVCYDLITGKKSSSYMLIKYAIEYITGDFGTKFLIENMQNGKQVECHISDDLDHIQLAFIYSNNLFVVEEDSENQSSMMFRIDIDNNSIQSSYKIKGYIDGSVFYKDIWYFTTYDYSVDAPMLMAYNLMTNKITKIKDTKTGDGNFHSLEAACGYIWVYWRGGGDGFYSGFVEKVKIP